MVDSGETAPRFDLPAVEDGEFGRVTLEEHLDDNVVVLAFYPGDFNPACNGTSSGLDDLDLFTMRNDTAVLAVSGDSVYSHRAFAEEYDLQVPLLADVRGEVATEYGVATRDEPYPTRRAVFVIDHTGQVEYGWVADDVEELPDTERIREAIESVGDDRTALARYRVGHARYVEGRRAFTSAMSGFEEREWTLSSRDFDRAVDEFDEARGEFDTAVRFSEDETATRYFERAERKAEALCRAANWLEEAATLFASGEGRRGEEIRQDAEAPLETARDIREPPDPDDFPPEEGPADGDGSASPSEDSLDLATSPTGDGAGLEPAAEGGPSGDTQQTEAGPTDGSDGPDDRADDADETREADIADEELEAITAELEEQNDAAGKEPAGTDSPSTADSDVDSADAVEEDIELELTDPTGGEDGEDPGDDAVPDSL